MARGRVVEGFKYGGKVLVPVNVRVFVCTNHDGWHGSSSARASVVVAKDEVHARELLDQALTKMKLMPFRRRRYTLEEIHLDRWTAEVLADGSL